MEENTTMTTLVTTLVPLDESKPFTKEEIALFEQKYLAACQNLAEKLKVKKQIEAEEKKAKEALGKVMDEFGIKSMDNPFVKFIRVAENPGKTTTIIDLDKMKEEEPELYAELLEDYPKQVTTGKKSAYVTFTPK